MMFKNRRHDVSLPHYRERLEKYVEQLKEGVDDIATAPFTAMMALNRIERVSRVALAVDPDASEAITWRFWTTWMQAAEGVFAMSTAPSGTTVERHIDHQSYTLSSLTPGPESGASTWISAFFLSVSCRDEERVRLLCQIPVAFIKEAGESQGGGYDDYVYPWISAIQDYILNRDTLGENIYAAMRLSQPEHATISSPENLNYFVFPVINSLYRLAELDTGKFDEALEQGIHLFHDYYTADEERVHDLSGAVPLRLLGVSCMAYDIAQVSAEFNPDLSSPYLPKHILQRTWHGEFAL